MHSSQYTTIARPLADATRCQDATTSLLCLISLHSLCTSELSFGQDIA